MTYDQLWESIKEPLVKHYDESDLEEGDVAYIREKVLTKLFPPCWVTQEQMVRITGEALLEMLYVAKVLGNKGSHRGVDVEIWYIFEWIQKKRINYKIKGRNSYSMETEKLAEYLLEQVWWLLPEK